MQTHSRSGQCRSFDFPLVTVARRFAVKSDWLVVCKLSVYFNACCVCLYMLHNTDCCICRLPNIYYYCSTSFITCVIWEINSPGSFSDAEIKVLMLVLSRFAFLYQLYKNYCFRLQTSCACVRKYMHCAGARIPARTASSGKLVITYASADNKKRWRGRVHERSQGLQRISYNCTKTSCTKVLF